MIRQKYVDVIIVGGGLAGLTAAYYILKKEASVSVLILESSGKPGGRLLTVPLLVKNGSSISFFDVSGGWVSKRQTYFWKLLQTLDIPLTTNKGPGKIILELDNRYNIRSRKDIFSVLSTFDKIEFTKFILEVEILCKHFQANKDIQQLKELSEISLQKFIDDKVGSEIVRCVIYYIVLLNCGCSCSEISALFYIFFCTSTKGIINQLLTEDDNIHEYRMRGSSHNIIVKLVEDIGRTGILINQHVVAVANRNNDIYVQTKSALFTCNSLILAISPRSIPNIRFIPKLSTDVCFSIQNTWSDVVTSFIVTYPKEFWKDRGFSGEIYKFDKTRSDGPIDYCRNITESNKPTLQGRIYTKREVHNEEISEVNKSNALFPEVNTCTVPTTAALLSCRQRLCGDCVERFKHDVLAVLECWYGAEGCRYLFLTTGFVLCIKIPIPFFKNKVLEQLSQYFGQEALYPTDYYEKSWKKESPQMTCWSKGNTNYINIMSSKPFDSIYFAGAETSSSWYGYLAGAVHSGIRAALQVLYDIRPSALTLEDLAFLNPAQRLDRQSFHAYNKPFQKFLVHWKYYAKIAVLSCVLLYFLKSRFL